MVTELPNDPQAERAFLGSLFARPQFVQKVCTAKGFLQARKSDYLCKPFANCRK